MEQNFQDVSQKLQYNNNSGYFADHFVQNFTQKTSQQQCHNI